MHFVHVKRAWSDFSNVGFQAEGHMEDPPGGGGVLEKKNVRGCSK